MQEYFQPKIDGKIRIFSLGWKNNILIEKKSEMGLTVNWQFAQKIVVNWYLAQELVVNW